MSETAAVRKRSSGGSVVLYILGAVVGLVALALLAGGAGLLWADQTQRDSAGYFTTSSHRFVSSDYAITHEGAKISGVPSWIDVGKLARVRIEAQATDGRPVFVGIAPQRDIDTYLANVAHSKLSDVNVDPFDPTYSQVAGTTQPVAPVSERFWAASASGAQSTLTWKVREGKWGVVVMNADGSPRVAADLKFGANLGYLDWIYGGLFGAGALLLALAALLVALGVRAGGSGAGGRGVPAGAAGADGAGGAALPPAGGVYPLVLTARLDEPLSRWLWLVKWLLLIPHAIVLSFLWAAWIVLTFVAWLAILATGRFPRWIFDFNVGVLRWTWRVHYYGYGTLGTDQYPPFSLGLKPDYPARLDVEYPERLSRGLTLVKWVLALPHIVIVTMFAGSGYLYDQTDVWSASWPSLVGVLALVAGVALLFSRRYPRGLFDLLVGLNRWVYRTLAYVGLMTDEYPPFRLDLGGEEPGSTSPAVAVLA
jgi:hypothetical protein